MGAVLGGYTAVRCSLQAAGLRDALACGVAGAAAVAVPTALDPGRVRFLQTVIGAAAASAAARGRKAPIVPAHFIVASAGMSGAVMLGLTDVALWRLGGLRW